MSCASELEIVFATGSVTWNRAINGNDRASHVVFVTELREIRVSDRARSSVIARSRRLTRAV